MRRYHIQDRDDYKRYNKIAGMITKLTNVLKQLDPQDSTRIELTDQLLDKWVRVCPCRPQQVCGALLPSTMRSCHFCTGTALQWTPLSQQPWALLLSAASSLVALLPKKRVRAKL